MMLRNNWKRILFILILVLGGIIRFWGVTSGLPDLYAHDEIFEVNRALQLLQGEYDFYRPMKGFYFYILAIIYAAYGSLMIMLDRFDSLAEFVSYSLVHTGHVIFLSRVITASLGTFSIYLLYRLGRGLFTSNAWGPELLLALAWSTCWLAAWLANWGFVETCLVTLYILAFFPILRILQEGRRKDYVVASVIIAMATATKIYGAVLLLPLGLAHFFSGSEIALRKRICRILDQKLCLAMVLFVAVWWLLDPSFVMHMLSQIGVVTPKSISSPVSDFPKGTHLNFYLTIVRWNIGNAILPFLVVGLVMSIWKRKKDILICAATSIIFLILLGQIKESNLVYARYVLISLPGLFIMSIYGIIVISEFLRFKNKKIGSVICWFLIFTVSILVGWNGIESLLKNYMYKESFNPVEAEAKEWFERNIPAGSKIVMKGEKVWPGNQTLPLFNIKENYLKRYDKAIRIGKRFKNMEVLPYLAKAEGIIRYDLEVIDRYDEWEDLNIYIENGVEYFVIHIQQFIESFVDKNSQRGKKSRTRFYKQLKQSREVVLIKRFEGRTLQGMEKTIEVYKVVSKEIGEVRDSSNNSAAITVQ